MTSNHLTRHDGAKARWLENGDALSVVFSFLVVNTSACFACADFFSAWHNITGTAEALEIWGRVENMFEAWYDIQMLWYLKHDRWQDYENGIGKTMFRRFLQSHALANALNDMFHLCSMKRRSDKSLPRYYRVRVGYSFTEERLKKSVPLVLQDWTEHYSVLEKYADVPHAYALSYLVFTHAPIQPLAWSEPYITVTPRKTYDTMADIASFVEKINFDRDRFYLKTMMLRGLMTPNLFVYAVKKWSAVRDVYFFDGEYGDRDDFLPVVDKMVRESRPVSVDYMLAVLDYYEVYYSLTFARRYSMLFDEVEARRKGLVSRVMPFLNKCAEDPKLVASSRECIALYQKNCMYPSVPFDRLLAKKRVFY